MIANAAHGGESFLAELLDDLGDVELGMQFYDCDLLIRAKERGRVEVDEASPRAFAFMFRSSRSSFVIQLSFFDRRLGRLLLLPGPASVGQFEAEIVIRLVAGRVSVPTVMDGILRWLLEGQYEARLPQLPNGQHFFEIRSADWQDMLTNMSAHQN